MERTALCYRGRGDSKQAVMYERLWCVTVTKKRLSCDSPRDTISVKRLAWSLFKEASRLSMGVDGGDHIYSDFRGKSTCRLEWLQLQLLGARIFVYLHV